MPEHWPTLGERILPASEPGVAEASTRNWSTAAAAPSTSTTDADADAAVAVVDPAGPVCAPLFFVAGATSKPPPPHLSVRASEKGAGTLKGIRVVGLLGVGCWLLRGVWVVERNRTENESRNERNQIEITRTVRRPPTRPTHLPS